MRSAISASICQSTDRPVNAYAAMSRRANHHVKPKVSFSPGQLAFSDIPLHFRKGLFLLRRTFTNSLLWHYGVVVDRALDDRRLDPVTAARVGYRDEVIMLTLLLLLRMVVGLGFL